MLKKIAFILILLLFLTPIILFVWWGSVSSPVNKDSKETKIIVVPQGWGVEQIGLKLLSDGMIKNVLAFKLMVAKEGISTKLQAGDFRLSPSMNLYEITDSLTHGTLDIWLTIPEGLRREEQATLIADSFSKHDVDFDVLEYTEKTASIEGYLFPDTYLVPKNSKPDDVIKVLSDSFEKKYSQIEIETGLSQKQIIILASLVEREAKYDEDRPLIAGILQKRLKSGWTLDVDATLQYALGSKNCSVGKPDCKWWPVVLGKDKEIVSPFNSYKTQGMPPAPICNPGLESIKAAANPEDSPYWFYLADPSGKTHYAKTLEEHNENISKYL
ncbi:endolytic transglycosylase MltG [Patescibacteria group bacterium]